MIDILLSTYNGQEHLAEQLDSILAQSFFDWRLLIRDDASSDNTTPLLLHYAERYPEKICIVDPGGGNLGACQSFGRLMEHSTAEHIMFCDQDDVWLPDKIALTVRRFQELEERHGGKHPLMVFTDAAVVDETLRLLAPSAWRYQHSDPEGAGRLNRIILMNPANGCTMMINRALLNRALPIPREAIMHDCWLALTAAALGKVAYLPQATLLYRQHGRNESGTWSWGPSYVVGQLANLKAAREAGARTRRQAGAFLASARGLTETDRSLLRAYAELDRRGSIGRRIDILRYGFFYTGLIRNIGWLLLC